MRKRAGLAALLGAFSLSACLPNPAPAPSDNPVTRVEPLAADGVERVVRFSVSHRSSILDPDDAWFFSGQLSDYHLGRINRRELPDTLASRRIAVNAWFDPELGQTWVAPVAELAPGETYTLVAPGWGRLAEVQVSFGSELAMMKRLWPPAGSAARSIAFYCGAGAEFDEAELALEPTHQRVVVAGAAGRSANGERCVKLDLGNADVGVPWQLLPPLAASVLWDPSPLTFQPEEPRHANSCDARELNLEAGCASVFDDRVVVQNGVDPMLYALEVDAEVRLFAVSAGESFTLRGLEPDRAGLLRGKSIDRFGDERPFAFEFRTLPAQAHLVLNEVLANALGPEPASEWVELVNDGSAAAELHGLRFGDGAAEIELPDLRLEAGEYALLVREDFPEQGPDVPPAAGTRLIRVPALGKNGLSNAGESLTLHDGSGRVLSRIPALASAHAGVSIARRTPAASDDAADSFAEHAAPGASPGAENALATSGAR